MSLFPVPGPQTGRGATQSPPPRFRPVRLEPDLAALAAAQAAALAAEDAALAPRHPATQVLPDTARSVLSHNQSPDVFFDRSLNPYRGCEHGCIYCYARPTHAYLDLSPGLDFETRLFAKHEAPALLRAALARPGYRCLPITLGANTDAYQPLERELRITRGVLEVLHECRHPLTVITKGSLVTRDIDLLAPLAAARRAAVFISLTTLDDRLKRSLEPRAAAGAARLRTIRELSAAGIPVVALLAPIIPAVNDHELEDLVAAAAEAGARAASWQLVRLPLEVAPLFRDWLQQHLPLRARHVMSVLQQMRGGRDNDPRFGQRMRGEGPYAQLLARRFAVAVQRHGLGERAAVLDLDCSGFLPPVFSGSSPEAGAQLPLW
ncbi:MAG: PA0069 family radical SAM protein [Gammaproteobacteria bacterium]